MVYNVVYAAAAFVTAGLYGKYNASKVIYVAFLIFLFSFAAFRFEVGCDYYSYYWHSIRFSELTFGEAATRSEPGYWEIVVLLKSVGLEFPAINVVASAMFFLGVHSIARRQPNPLMYLTLLFPILITGIPMSAVRQAMAMGLIAFAYNSFADRKLISYIFWVIIAGQFHSSAYLFLAGAPLIYNGGKVNRSIVGLILVFGALYFASRSEMAEQYSSKYSGTEIEAAGAKYRVVFVAFTGFVMLLLYRSKWQKFCQNDYELAFYFSIASVAMLPLLAYSSVAGDRYGYYLMLITSLIQARLYLLTPPSLRQPVFLAPLAIAGIQLLGWTMLSPIFDSCYSEYKTWWSE
jgi:EpsG family